jgi:hypothetical protein
MRPNDLGQDSFIARKFNADGRDKCRAVRHYFILELIVSRFLEG